MANRIKGRGSRNGLLALTGVALAAVLVAPMSGAASTSDGGFGVKAVNSENEEIFGLAGSPGYGNPIVVTPEEPSGPIEGQDPENPYVGSSVSSFVGTGHVTVFQKSQTRVVNSTLYGNEKAVATIQKLVDDAGLVGTVTTNPSNNTKEMTYRVSDTRYPNISNPTTYERTGWGFGLWSGDDRFNGDNFATLTITIGESIPPTGQTKGVPYLSIGMADVYWKPSAPNAEQAKIASDATNIWLPTKKFYLSHGGNDYYFDISKGK